MLLLDSWKLYSLVSNYKGTRMFKSNLFLVLALSTALLPLNSFAMEGMPNVPGGVPAAPQPANLAAAAAQPAPQAGAQQVAQPAQQPGINWTRLGRQLSKPLAFFAGAAALGGVTYGSLKNDTQSSQLTKALAISMYTFMGGMMGLDYCKPKVDRLNNRTYNGSLLSSLGFSATAATVGLLAHKVGASPFATILAYCSAWLVGNSMYYAQ